MEAMEVIPFLTSSLTCSDSILHNHYVDRIQSLSILITSLPLFAGDRMIKLIIYYVPLFCIGIRIQPSDSGMDLLTID